MTAALGFVFRIEAEMHERIVALARFHDHVAALAAVAAGRTAARNELLPPEGQTALPPSPAFTRIVASSMNMVSWID